MITLDYQFPQEIVTGLTTMAGACLLLPLLYFILFTARRKISFAAILAGAFSFALFVLIWTVLQGETNAANIPLNALYVSVLEFAGCYLPLRLLSKRNDTPKTPVGFALGFAVIPIVVIYGVKSLNELSFVNSFNREGYENMLALMPDEISRAAMLAEVERLAGGTLTNYALITFEYVCGFLMTVGLCRLIWYTLGGRKLSTNVLYLIVLLVLRLTVEIFYQMPYSIGSQYTYYAGAMLIFGLSLLAAKFFDPKVFYTERLGKHY
jgi:uncharacterized membrane protein YhfC